MSLIADEATKKRARSLSLCDGNDFPATVASRRPKSNARRGCQRRANSVVGFISHTFCCLYLLSSSPLGPGFPLYPSPSLSSPKFKAGGRITPQSALLSVTDCVSRTAGQPAARPSDG